MTRRRSSAPFEWPQLNQIWAAWLTLESPLDYIFVREATTDLRLAYIAQHPPGKRRRALQALQLAFDLIGAVPSQEQYRHLRLDRPEFERQLPSDASIRAWLGGLPWSECCREAMLFGASEDGDFTSPQAEGPFSEEECAGAIRECMADHDGEVPTLYRYQLWAHRSDVRARPGRRPLSARPFDVYGGFRAVLERNGLVPEGGLRKDARGRVLPLSYAYNDAELREALREVERRLGRSPRESEYTRERKLIHEESARSGSAHTIPTSGTLTRRFGPWSNVVREAGLPPIAPGSSPQKTHVRTARYSTEEKLDRLREAWVQLGEPFTEVRYDAWRRERLDEAAERGDAVWIPASITLVRLAGSWQKACALAIPDRQPRERGRS